MKRILCILVVLFVIAFGAFAQSVDFTAMQSSFDQFATDVANSLPFNALIGLNWSDAYIGQLLGTPPHFGIGLTTGFTTIPFAAVKQVIDQLPSLSLPPEAKYIEAIGFPVPAYTIDARIGGFILPFDVGLKVGYIWPDALKQLGIGVTMDYLLIGGDVRYALLQENVALPAISVGLGYTFMEGTFGIPGVYSGDIPIANVPGSGGLLSISNPALNFKWTTNVIDLKAQISKSLLIITPYLGLGAAYGTSTAGGGLTSQLLYNGNPISQSQIDQIIQAFQAAGQPVPSQLNSQGIIVQKSSIPGWAFRTYGGLSLNLAVIKIDLTGMYNFTSNSWGGSVGLRFQL